MLSRRKVLSSGAAAASALVFAATTGADRSAARPPKRPFIPQPAHIPADYVPCC
jgi:hypothetical protein